MGALTNQLRKSVGLLPMRGLLLLLLVLIAVSTVSTYVSRYFMMKSLESQRLSNLVMFELKLAHNYYVRDADIALRGYGIVEDESYLYISNEFLAMELEQNFERLDSLLLLQKFDSPSGLRAVEVYKKTMRNFLAYQGKAVELLRSGQRDQFLVEFKKDVGSFMWPSFVGVVEEVSRFEEEIAAREKIRYQVFSTGLVLLQTIILGLAIPLVVHMLKRLRVEQHQSKLLEDRKLEDEKNKVKENMLSMMSHEIRTPLNSLIGLAHLLQSRNPREDQKEILRILRSSGDHLLHLVNDILDFNKIQANKLQLERENFSLKDLLKQIHAIFENLAKDRGLELKVMIDMDVPEFVVGDPTRLIQVLNNLINNAIKFTERGHIKVHVLKEYSDNKRVTVRFAISDTGIGIPKESLPLLFQPFHQVEKHSPRKFGGTGLGLLIVKNLVEMMGGRLTVQSEVGLGSEFIVSIPFEPQHNQTRKVHVPVHNSREYSELQGCKVLIAEDVPSNQFLVTSLLEDRGVICTTASSGEETINACTTTVFDVILLDIQMPDQTGFDACKSIRTMSVNKNTPVILFSAYTDITEADLIKCGANDVLGKPFKPEDLFDKIQKYFRKDQE